MTGDLTEWDDLDKALRSAIQRAVADGTYGPDPSTPGAPQPFVIPDGWGDRPARRKRAAALRRTAAKAERDRKRHLTAVQSGRGGL